MSDIKWGMIYAWSQDYTLLLHSEGNKGYAVTLQTLEGLRLSVNKGVLCAGVMSNALMIQSIDLLHYYIETTNTIFYSCFLNLYFGWIKKNFKI